eukprot:m.8621 g.8621  ORF g.8621 m.8621 type:complete len:298 (+) comp5258_c0_seq1:239-1132(+)
MEITAAQHEQSSTRSSQSREYLRGVEEAPPLPVWHCIWRGFVDSFNFVAPIGCLYNRDKVRYATWSCFQLNGIIFIGGLLLYHLVILQATPMVLRIKDGEDFGPIRTVVDGVYNLLWVYPMFFVCKIINSIYYQVIADEAFLYGEGSNSAAQKRESVPNLMYSLLVELLLLIQASVFTAIPYVWPLGLIYSCWLSSLYSVEYQWINLGLSAVERFTRFERYWAYFLGFGLFFTVLTFFLPFFYGSGLFGLLFPLYIMIGTQARPMPARGCGSLRIFGVAQLFASRIIKYFVHFVTAK